MVVMSELIIHCPACQRPLRVGSHALGQRGRCSHCHANFSIPRLPDGSAGAPVLRSTIRRSLIIPAVGLLLLGLAGLLVNGYLATLFYFQPGSDVAYARTQLVQLRQMQKLSQYKPLEQDWEHGPRASVAGVPMAAYTAQIAEDLADEPVAQSWAPSLLPVQLGSAVLSLLVFLGGLSIIRGKFYAYALLSCVLAVLNINHLCCIPGVIVGIWGIVMLARDDVRLHFR